MKHANISIFVPHLGCPNQCSFCDQRSITGVITAPKADDIDKAVFTALSTDGYCCDKTEIAFFGGSFTAISREYMVELLQAAYKHVAAGRVTGIRISTRPDCIDENVLGVLKQYGVTAIELGAQSMCDEVLLANNRGHVAKDVSAASSLIKEFGFELGLQMMTGLYKSTSQNDIDTARSIIALKPQTVRIYPAITLKNTQLEKLFLNGEYTPQSVPQAVELCAQLLQMFRDNNIKVIRLGLHSINKESYVVGPWHPAFCELCESEIFLGKIKEKLTEPGNYKIGVHPKSVSKVIGNKRYNIEQLKNNGFVCTVIQDKRVDEFDVMVERMGNSCT